MALTLTLDPPEKVILEPGYHQSIGAGEAIDKGQVDTPADTGVLWRVPGTGAVMLRPQNTLPNWLNSPDQVASIIRHSAMVVSDTDNTNLTVFEEAAFGNPNNFYIYHAPVGAAGTPFAPKPLPGAPPSIVGAPYGGDLSGGLDTISAEHEIPFSTYSAPATTTGSVADGKLICYTSEPLPANQAFYFRWFQPNPKIGYQTRYMFYFGQLVLEVAGSMVYLYTDISPSLDRSSYGRIFAAPMFGNDFSGSSSFVGRRLEPTAYSWIGNLVDPEGDAHDRSLLIIPYFRNRLLLSAFAGNNRAAVYSPRIKLFPVAEASGSDNDWDITSEATVGVWVMSPAPGRFQLQKVRYADGPATLDLPHVSLDYTPAVPPVVAAYGDADHTTSITGTVSEPPVYALRFNDLNGCPPPTTEATDQSLTYGVQLTFTGESTHRWTPFLYGLTFDAPTVLQNTTTTPATVLDTGVPATNIQDGIVSWGEEPGEGRMDLGLWDETPYALSPYYYRCELPVQLALDGVKVFTGLSDMIEVTPLHELLRPRRMKLPATDRWKQLAHYHLRDQNTKTGIGHITTVLNIAEQAGIDTSTAETPPLTAAYNTPLALWDSDVPRTDEQADLIRGAWRPQPEDTAADFILRIVKLFSGWDVGFRPDGTLFYLPKDYFTAISYRFFFSQAAATAALLPNNAHARNVVNLETLEPEANAVVVYGASDANGETLTSSYWVDWASIRNPAVQNYLGRWKPVVIKAPGVFNCPELNRIARVTLDATRRRHRRISFEAPFVSTLKYGQIVEVGTYGNYRLKKCKVEFRRTGWAPAQYEAEYVPTPPSVEGYGL